MKDTQFHSLEEYRKSHEGMPGALLSYGTYAIVVSTMLLLLIGHWISYPDVVSGPVKVMGSNPVVYLSPQLDGRIGQLFCRSGDMVMEGQVLLELDNPAQYADIQRVRQWLDTLGLAASDTLPPDHMHFPKVMQLGKVQPYFWAFLEQWKQKLLWQRLRPDDMHGSITRDRTSHNSRWLLDSERLERELENTVRLGAKDVERYKTLYQKGVVSTSEYEERQRQQLLRKQELTALRQRMAETRLFILSQEDGRLLQGLELSREQGLLEDRLRHTRSELLGALEAYERDYVLVAPTSGTVNHLQPLALRQQVFEGKPLFAIFPQKNESGIGQMEVTAINKGKVRKGQKVLLQLENYPTSEYGTLEAQVQGVNQVPHPETGSYGITLRIPSMETSYGRTLPLDGVSLGTGRIVTEEMSLLQRLFRGIRAQFQRN
ncbi:HlyD family secretion protein [Flagellimonas nanhaiensis]|uniref:HlyD family efflux transporter periplasmic adaptor subunit n=1 Tax=Flagellimonas nanhaiensis TaxID=2292706 RepID=A0A371JLP1_9FLAO|nr:HlyD family efflux transporter periplasmic adaptor subunit [Allomuricauda nanhaiensis]RDY57907.1 HlyD family efflux transporter periplasmic adaptor subunit [Allomuricauda nanhaiensis]